MRIHGEQLLKFFFVILLGYGTYLISAHQEPTLLSAVNLIFHEAGHLIFLFFGKTLMILGGTLMQLIVPLICLAAFIRQNDFYAAAIMSWWVGDNLVNISIYIADANIQILPLLGDGTHDWHALLSTWHILPHAEMIGTSVGYLGIFTMITSLIWALTRIITPHAYDRTLH